MKTYSFYAESNGAIRGVLTTSSSGSEMPIGDYAYVDGEVDGGTHYILNGVPTPRPSQSTTITGSTLSNLPTPCTIHIDGAEYACTDTTAELSFTFPGTYKVRVSAFPHLEWETEVTV